MPTIRPRIRRFGATTATVVALGAAALVLSGCSSSSTSPSGTPSAAAPAAGGGHHAHGVRGTVTAENATSWTVTTPKNETVTVTITPQTQFGSKKTPATAATFPVGSQIMIMGQRTGNTVTATRIRAAGQHKGAKSAPAPSQ